MTVERAGQSRWVLPERNEPAVTALCDELGVSHLVASILVRRGLTDPVHADRFLNPSFDHFHDPKLLPDYDAACKVILGAHEAKKTIYVHGDYDVDGVTSAALLTRFLSRIGCNVVPHVPHRVREGYGIHLDAINWAKEKGTDLFLTCDCGTSAHEQVLAARQAGMEVVVTDHHQVTGALPEAQAVVNPHRSDSNYPWKDLCGAGVAFKLCAGLTRELGHKVEQYYRAFLDLAVMGTVADVMPLLDENRIITRFGLPRLLESNKIGIQALLRYSNLSGNSALSARNIGFQIGPRINAVGRIDDSALALDLLLTEDADEADRLANKLEQVNFERRAAQNRAVEEAIEMAESTGMHQGNIIFLGSENWHPGVIGLIAGRLTEKYRRPTFAMTFKDGVAKGSGRSIPGFDLGSAIQAVLPILIGGGGHEMAAGFSVHMDRLEDLRAEFGTFASQSLGPEHFVSTIQIDAEVDPSEVRASTLSQMKLLEPFGTENEEPVFLTENVQILAVTPTSNPDHARVKLSTTDGVRNAMAFGNGRLVASIPVGSNANIVFTADENIFNGATSYRWVLKDIQLAND